jgi:hypothetical protein
VVVQLKMELQVQVVQVEAELELMELASLVRQTQAAVVVVDLTNQHQLSVQLADQEWFFLNIRQALRLQSEQVLLALLQQ